MSIWYGNINDTTNFATDKYLQINSCGFQNTFPDYTVIRKEGRYDYHILMINSGICKAWYKDKSYTLTKGNMIVYPPHEKQKYSFKTESSTLWCHFGGSMVEELLNSSSIDGGVYFLNPSKAVFDSFSSMIQRFHQPGKEKFANASFLELIYNIGDATESCTNNDNMDAILPILTYINANYNKKITNDELAKKSGYSKSRFSHIFSETVGTTPVKYQNSIRLKISCEMLNSTKLSITEISQACGFSDPLYFSRIFKREYNLSPTEYRNSNL